MPGAPRPGKSAIWMWPKSAAWASMTAGTSSPLAARWKKSARSFTLSRSTFAITARASAAVFSG